MKDLDDDIRRAFLAVRQDPAARERLIAGRRTEPWSRWALAAAAVVAVGLAGVPAVQTLSTYLPAGLVASAVERVDVPMHPLDAWIPPGSAVHVSSARSGWATDLGVQRLISVGERAVIEVADPVAWGTGPDGEVRLARVDGPLRELAVSASVLPEGDVGAVAYSNGVDGLVPVELIARDAHSVRVRMEPEAFLDITCCTDDDVARFASSWLSAAWERSNVEVRVLDAPPKSYDMLALFDAQTGLALGRFKPAWHRNDGMVTAFDVMGQLLVGDRSLRIGIPRGDHVEVALPLQTGATPGDLLDLREVLDGRLIHRASSAPVVALVPGGVRVAVPWPSAGPLLRAHVLQAVPTHLSSTTQVSFTPRRSDETLLTTDFNVVGLVGGQLLDLGTSHVTSVDRDGLVDVYTFRTETPHPPTRDRRATAWSSGVPRAYASISRTMSTFHAGAPSCEWTTGSSPRSRSHVQETGPRQSGFAQRTWRQFSMRTKGTSTFCPSDRLEEQSRSKVRSHRMT